MWTFLVGTKLGRSIGMILAGLILLGLLYVSFHIWLNAHDKNILHGYVVETRATTAEAKLLEAERQARANKVVADAYQVQYKNALKIIDDRDAQDDADRQAYEASKAAAGKPVRPPLDDDDMRFLNRVRK